MSFIKQQLHDACGSSLDERIVSLETAVKQIQQSANEETKSSAGDKYETGRAMAQLEIEKMSAQLAELRKMRQELSRISPAQKSMQVTSGSLLYTSHGNFYIAVNAGQFTIHEKVFYAVSLNSPIAQHALTLSVEDTFTLNGKTLSILAIE